MGLTPQQQDAVLNRNGKLLVSAAAGSGKTKVLVDRIMSYIQQSNGKINIDDFLIITYTHAAAAELRSKIAAKLNEKLSEDPGNWHLQRQVQRLYMAKISTVHSFCGDLLREYAYKVDIPGDFRIADEKETQLIKYQVLENLMESAFEESDMDILTFIDSQELKRNDRSIPPVIQQVYSSAMCHIDPKRWLDECLHSCNVQGLTDASQTLWGKYLIDDLHNYLDLQIQALSQCAKLAMENGSMPKPAALLEDTVSQLQYLRSLTSWDEIVAHKNIVYGDLRFPSKATDPELIEQIKEIRNTCKKKLATKLLPFMDNSDKVLTDLQSCGSAISGLIKLVEQFQVQYERIKKARHILDFADLEHRTLDLLRGRKRDHITALAHEVGQRFCEVMIDEYQDSNEVQDAIFSALTDKKQNCFMVGDVKQSIYQFRLADPTIFISKYNTYLPADQAIDGQGRKVMLSSNFRSAGAVIEAVNHVFRHCMSPRVGGLDYDEDAQLNEGIPHTPIDETEVELTVLQVQSSTYEEDAVYTANRIVDLLDGTHMVRDGETVRPMQADDIAILLRSPKSSGAYYQAALEAKGYRVNSASGVNILESEEIVVLRSLLQVISNPLQDIPLLSVLSSRIFCFTANELSEIRAENNRRYFYDSLKCSANPKAKQFIELLTKLRSEAQLYSVSQMIERIFALTRMDSIFSAFPQGATRLDNLRILSSVALQCEAGNVKQIDSFLDYLDSLGEEGISKPPEHKIPGAITIMSIHKSKGLEFPVVFLCGLSRDFSRRSITPPVLCNRELGIGLNCVDLNNRVHYPSIARKAIATKILSDGLSEEMRVLYVAMTRARDRLIMTYPVKNPEKELLSIRNRMDICDPLLLTLDAMCPGEWILLSALHRMEAGAFFALCGRPKALSVSSSPWKISVESTEVDLDYTEASVEVDSPVTKSIDTAFMKRALQYSYPYVSATTFPSKQTATQLKGRYKDQEAADNTHISAKAVLWRAPDFIAEKSDSGVAFGNALHTVMQYIRYRECGTEDSISRELLRLQSEGLVSEDMAGKIKPETLMTFFNSAIGQKVINAENVLREFKFSILDDAKNYATGMLDEQILLQGVVDCAVLEEDGITVIDFKTDYVTDQTIPQKTDLYDMQIKAYAHALSRIYQLPLKAAYLYFFHNHTLVPVL